MALIELPTWLSVTPRDYISSAEAGTRAGLQQRSQDASDVASARSYQMQQQQMSEAAVARQQAAQERASALDLERQKLAQHGQLQAMEFDMQRQKIAQESMMRSEMLRLQKEKVAKEEQRNSILGAYRNKKLDLDIAAAQQKFAARQQYTKMIEDGMSPEEAMLKVGPMMSAGSDTMSAAFRSFQSGKATLPPETYTTPTGAEIVKWGDHYIATKPTKDTSSEDERKATDSRRKTIETQLRALQAKMKDPSFAVDSTSKDPAKISYVREINDRYMKLLDELSKLGDSGGDGGTQGSSDQQNGAGAGIVIKAIRQKK